MFVPALAGLGAPFWAPEARGGWVGLSLATRRADLVRAVAHGIAAQVATLGRAIGDDLGRPLERLRVDGGLSRSAVLMQAQADLLQVPVERYPSADATALGVAAFARLGAGAATTPAEAVGDWTPAGTFEPRMGADEAADAARALAGRRRRARRSRGMTAAERDVVVVGAGVVGTAIARALARHRLRVTLLEAGPDVGAGTSKANTALLHTGFDAKPGTIEARLVRRGCELLADYAAPRRDPGRADRARCSSPGTTSSSPRCRGSPRRRARTATHDLREVDADELREREPHLGPGARGALEVPGEAIVCPFTPPLAFATEAVLAGCELRRNARVTGLVHRDGGWEILLAGATGPPLRTRFLVNAAGLRSDEVHRMAGRDGFTVTPRRGELIVFDKLARPLVRHILLAVPTTTTKGVLVAPTVFGNVMLGPTADDIADKDGDRLDRDRPRAAARRGAADHARAARRTR